MIRLFLDGILYSLAMSAAWHFVLSEYTANFVRVIGFTVILLIGMIYIRQLNAYWRDKKGTK
jgi:hypothetical protein